MKKVLLSFFFAFTVVSLSAQVLFTQDFSGGTMPPTGWTVFGNTSNWAISNTNNAGGTIPEGRLKNSPAFTGYMRLISPLIDLTGQTSVIIQFKHMFEGGSFTLGVDTRANYSAWTNVWTLNTTSSISGSSVIIPVSNANVGSDKFQLALYINGSSTSMLNWYFDDIQILSPLAVDAMMAGTNVPNSFMHAKEVSGNVANLGTTTITSLDVNWQLDEGTIYTTHFDGLSIGLGEQFSYTCNDSINVAPGNYTFKVWVSGVNGSTSPDDNPDNDLLTKDITVHEYYALRRPMFEEFTSSTCSPCASFNSSVLNPFIEAHGEELTLVKYQMNWPGSGDPYYTAEGGVRRTYYGVNAVPELFVDGSNVSTSASAVNTAFNNSKVIQSYVNISSTHVIDGDNVIIHAKISPYDTYQGVTAQIAVVERVTTGNVATNGETEFHNVMMKMVPDANGTSVNLLPNQPVVLNYTQNMSATNVEEMDDLRVAIFVQKSNKEIIESNYSVETGSFITMTPANGATNVSLTDPLLIEFSHPVQLKNGTPLTNSNVGSVIMLKENNPNGANANYTVSINSEKTIITVTPSPSLLFNQTYYLKVDTLENIVTGVHTLATSSTFTTRDNVGTPEAPTAENIKVYPNPAKDIVNVISYETGGIQAIDLVNLYGKTVRSYNNFDLGGSSAKLTVGDIPAGVYFLRITGKNSRQMIRLVLSN
jgi:hypothetical protein